jgi:hypothetical protein
VSVSSILIDYALDLEISSSKILGVYLDNGNFFRESKGMIIEVVIHDHYCLMKSKCLESLLYITSLSRYDKKPDVHCIFNSSAQHCGIRADISAKSKFQYAYTRFSY